MPDAARELDAVRSYGLAFSVMLTTQLLGIVLAGVWCDRSGPLPSLFAGQLLFAVGCGLCGSSQAFGPFLAGRGVAGLGAGLIIVAGYVVIGRAYPESLRPKVFSVISAAWVLPSLLGPPIAAWVTTTWSWRWVFWLVVVPVVVAVVLVFARRRRSRPPTRASTSRVVTTASTRGRPGSGCSSRLPRAPSSGAPTTSSSGGRPRPPSPSSASSGSRPPHRCCSPGDLAAATRAAVGDARAVPADLFVLRHHHLHPAHARQRARPVARRRPARSWPSGRSAGRPARGSRAATAGPGAATGSSSPAGCC